MKTQHTYDMERLWSALTLMHELHEGQTDKCGQPYWIHPFDVAVRFIHRGVDISIPIVGLLHDILEDTDITLQELLCRFPMKIDETYALELLTRKKGTTYYEYIKSIANSGNRIAILVKMSDLEHNQNLNRFTEAGLTITKQDERRVKRYNKAYNILFEALKGEPK